MTESHEDLDRQVVPRWRTYTAAVSFGEVGSLVGASKPQLEASDLDDLKEDWRREPSPSVAADLVSAAVTCSREGDVADEAKLVLDTKALPGVARQLAGRCLSGTNWHDGSTGAALHSMPAEKQLEQAVRSTRNNLCARPRNPVLWSHLALLHATLGSQANAERAMQIAHGLAPTSRFITRCATRMHLHFGNTDRAYHAVASSHKLLEDPWLLAGEIAVANALGRSSRNIKRAKKLVASQNLSPFDLSELNSALATLEAQSGNTKNARSLSRESLVEAAENAVAQVSWLDRKVGGFDLDIPELSQKQSSEASSWAARMSGEWQASRAHAMAWMCEQPFSSRPATLLAYIDSTVREDFSGAIATLERSLRSNPNDVMMTNNLAFAYAKNDKPVKAAEVLSHLPMHQLVPSDLACVIATQGLIAFRSGEPVVGATLYEVAIDVAGKAKLDRLRALASAYLAIEASRARCENAVGYMSVARSELSKLDRPLMSIFREKLDRACLE